uniref:Bac_rhamnosid6H domain-containing protein n=1 Tax=Panagrellus redivivus TaxID=6233 RepID=A0A7E4W708_PANRE
MDRWLGGTSGMYNGKVDVMLWMVTVLAQHVDSHAIIKFATAYLPDMNNRNGQGTVFWKDPTPNLTFDVRASPGDGWLHYLLKLRSPWASFSVETSLAFPTPGLFYRAGVILDSSYVQASSTLPDSSVLFGNPVKELAMNLSTATITQNAAAQMLDAGLYSQVCLFKSQLWHFGNYRSNPRNATLIDRSSHRYCQPWGARDV